MNFYMSYKLWQWQSAMVERQARTAWQYTKRQLSGSRVSLGTDPVLAPKCPESRHP